MTDLRVQDLRRLSDYEWEIPQTLRSDMRVPVRVFATRRMLEAIMDDKSLVQAMNAATLPGVVGWVAVMPDVHQGYGFPIGGVAATRVRGGVISPGAIGYDINCLPGDTPVLHPWGYTRPLAQVSAQSQVTCLDLRSGRPQATPVVRTWQRAVKPDETIFRLCTLAGAEIIATGDHPFWTPEGMVPVERLGIGARVARYPFRGAPYEPPGDAAIITVPSMTAFLRRTGLPAAQAQALVERMQGQGLLPLHASAAVLPRLARLAGFALAALYTRGARVVGDRAEIAAPERVLDGVQADLDALGWSYQRVEADLLHLTDPAALYLAAYLGVGLDDRTHLPATVPLWVRRAPRWIQRLFLAGFFSLTLPLPEATDAGVRQPPLRWVVPYPWAHPVQMIFHHLAELLEGFGVSAHILPPQLDAARSEGIVVGLEFEDATETLANLWQTVGVEFDAAALAQGLRAVHYRQCRAAAAQPEPPVPVTWADFTTWATEGLAPDAAWVWDVVVEKTAIAYDQPVYDLTVAHDDHNFVAATFVVSNCGVRLLSTQLPYAKAEPYLDDLATRLDMYCPSGVGKGGHLKLKPRELDQVAVEGARWALKHGYADPEDLRRTEEGGRLPNANPDKVSARAKERGRTQLGTLGAGNHFLEVDVVERIYDEEAAWAMGLTEGMLAVQIHCGSRGYGHQICTDYVRQFQKVVHKYGIRLPDRELVAAPVDSPEGQDYLQAMNAAANFAFANRQILAHFVRRAFEETFAGKARQREWYPRQVYDLAHNIGKVEVHTVNGQRVKVVVHRKGATRAFPPGAPGLPPEYMEVGQPVLVPGSMGTASWVLVGAEGSMRKSFGSSCHGAGRVMSRARAKKTVRGEALRRELEGEGIRVRAGSMRGLAEEAPFAYKDVDAVVETVVGAGLARKVARLRPVAVVKG
ncbi:MAG: RNA-splicing ligase RtcB [Chloroflexi bacterium]|nr:RNA-splicing ligase RtcB [Chloroflexota bacterium]